MGGASLQPGTAELNPQDPHGGGREPTPASLSSDLHLGSVLHTHASTPHTKTKCCKEVTSPSFRQTTAGELPPGSHAQDCSGTQNPPATLPEARESVNL